MRLALAAHQREISIPTGMLLLCLDKNMATAHPDELASYAFTITLLHPVWAASDLTLFCGFCCLCFSGLWYCSWKKWNPADSLSGKRVRECVYIFVCVCVHVMSQARAVVLLLLADSTSAVFRRDTVSLCVWNFYFIFC